MVAPGVALLLLGVSKIRGNDVGPPVISFSLGVGRLRGDSGLNNRLVTLIAMPLVVELLIHLRAEDLRGSRDELEDPAGGAGRRCRVDLPRVPEFVAALW